MEGVDYSYSRPDPHCLRYAHGIEFAGRYVGGRSAKNLTLHEADQLRFNRIAPVAFWETIAGAMTQGAHGGRAARHAYDDARACGMPPDRPIYFALDVDPRALTHIQWRRVETFLGQAAAEIGADQVGVYGGHAAIERLVPGHARWGFQTVAWSGGRVSAKAHVLQYRIDLQLCGGVVDRCRSLVDDFGQWPIDVLVPAPAAPVPQLEEPDMLIVQNKDSDDALLLSGDVAYTLTATDLKRIRDDGHVRHVKVSPGQFDTFRRRQVP
jgi:hypothetical protein